MSEQPGEFTGRSEPVISKRVDWLPTKESQKSEHGPKIKEVNPPADWPQRGDTVDVKPECIARLRSELRKPDLPVEKFTVTDFLVMSERNALPSKDDSRRFRYDLRSSGPDATSVRVYPDEITKSNE